MMVFELVFFFFYSLVIMTYWLAGLKLFFHLHQYLHTSTLQGFESYLRVLRV
ncbi:hypothetical protein BDD12DRAFT_831149 [Trichophaea hybrida]|nr:hypothetical protein BDD12DRAFT_831149 [Trichophaea hybrida]